MVIVNISLVASGEALDEAVCIQTFGQSLWLLDMGRAYRAGI